MSGLDVVHTREVGLATADDPEIIQWCRDEGRIVITLDADFHSYLALSGAELPSVIRIRIEGLRDLELSALIRHVLATVQEDLTRGSAVTVTMTSIRVRALPLIPR